MSKRENLFKTSNPTDKDQAPESSSAPEIVDKNPADLTANILNKPRKPKGQYYSSKEDKEMIKYVTQKQNSFLDAIHMSFWVEAEDNGLCPGRSAASLHERWRKLSIALDEHDIDKKLSSQIKQYACASMMARRKIKDKILGEQTTVRGPPFSRKEDKAILDFINEDPTRDQLRNNLSIWVLAEKLNVCPSRTPNSLMIRYRRLRRPKVVKSEAIDVEDEDDPPVANEKSPPKTPANREGSISEEENLIIDENSGSNSDCSSNASTVLDTRDHNKIKSAAQVSSSCDVSEPPSKRTRSKKVPTPPQKKPVVCLERLPSKLKVKNFARLDKRTRSEERAKSELKHLALRNWLKKISEKRKHSVIEDSDDESDDTS